jgi:hypothetical protein
MKFALPLIGLTLCLLAAGQQKWIVCHNGREIEIADPAVLNAHLAHGDCISTCDECERACCLGGGELIVGITLSDCEAIGGRFQWSLTDPCFEGGD